MISEKEHRFKHGLVALAIVAVLASDARAEKRAAKLERESKGSVDDEALAKDASLSMPRRSKSSGKRKNRREGARSRFQEGTRLG